MLVGGASARAFDLRCGIPMEAAQTNSNVYGRRRGPAAARLGARDVDAQRVRLFCGFFICDTGPIQAPERPFRVAIESKQPRARMGRPRALRIRAGVRILTASAPQHAHAPSAGVCPVLRIQRRAFCGQG